MIIIFMIISIRIHNITLVSQDPVGLIWGPLAVSFGLSAVFSLLSSLLSFPRFFFTSHADYYHYYYYHYYYYCFSYYY